MKNLRLLLFGLLFIFMGSCKDKENKGTNRQCPINATIGTEINILGTWKLAKIESYSNITKQTQIQNYSCNNVTFIFQSDKQLIVSSDVDNNIGFTSGKYNYETILQNEQYDKLKINDNLYTISVSANKMIVEVNPVNPLATYIDKTSAYFIKVKNSDNLN